jgi:hypothetical protein
VRPIRVIFVVALAGLSLAAITLNADEKSPPAAPPPAPPVYAPGLFPLFATQSGWDVNRGTRALTLQVLDSAGATLSIPADLAANATSNRPVPKARPKLITSENSLGMMTNNPRKISESPAVTIFTAFISGLMNQTSVAWDHAVRRERLDWNAAIDLQCVFIVEADKGTLAITSITSASDPALIAYFRKTLESLAPIKIPDLLRAIVGPQVRLKLDFANTPSPAPASAPQT